ncbi:MAG: PadR family transcriptional regulator [Christensenellaceae bacterium]
MISNELLESMVQEIRRGSIVLCVLSRLGEPKYGYALLTELNEKGLNLDAGTLYPLLRRLEKQGLLESQWNTDGAKPRKYYCMNMDGRDALGKLKESWSRISEIVEDMLGEDGK